MTETDHLAEQLVEALSLQRSTTRPFQILRDQRVTREKKRSLTKEKLAATRSRMHREDFEYTLRAIFERTPERFIRALVETAGANEGLRAVFDDAIWKKIQKASDMPNEARLPLSAAVVIFGAFGRNKIEQPPREVRVAMNGIERLVPRMRAILTTPSLLVFLTEPKRLSVPAALRTSTKFVKDLSAAVATLEQTVRFYRLGGNPKKKYKLPPEPPVLLVRCLNAISLHFRNGPIKRSRTRRLKSDFNWVQGVCSMVGNFGEGQIDDAMRRTITQFRKQNPTHKTKSKGTR